MYFLIAWLIVFAIIVAMAIRKVSQWSVWLKEWLWKYTWTAGPWITFLIPWIQTIKIIDIREQVMQVPEQEIITADNVAVTVDWVVYAQIIDPARAQYEVNNVFMAVINLTQTTLRSVLWTMSLDETLSNRDAINAKLLSTLDAETGKWWIKVLRVEIKRLDPPVDIQNAMSKQMKAEREKRAQILEAEWYKQALITKSEWDKKSQILKAEWLKESEILEAEWQANATIKLATAEAEKIKLESEASIKYFEWNAITKEQLKVVENSLQDNTKFILDPNILASLWAQFGFNKKK